MKKAVVYSPGFLTFFSLLLIMLFAKSTEAQISGEIGVRQFDYSDFKPITPEDFVKKHFDFLKREYKKDPSILMKGYKIEVVPASNPRYHPTVRTNQIYNELVTSTVLEWAKNNGFRVFLDNGYNLWNSDSTININYTNSFWGPPYNKTLEQDFKDNNRWLYTDEVSDFRIINKHYGSFHGLLDYETEIVSVANPKIQDTIRRKIAELGQDKQTVGNDKMKNLILGHADHYQGSIILIDSKYGGISGSVETNGHVGQLDQVTKVLGNLLEKCDEQIGQARNYFYKQMGLAAPADTSMPHGDNILVVVSAKGYRAFTTELDKKDFQGSDIYLSGIITDKNGHPLNGVKISFIGQNVSFVTDSSGRYTLHGKAHGKSPLTETLNIKLERVGIKVSIDNLGVYEPDKNFGIVSDGFSTLKLHIKTFGIDPSSVVVQPPALGGFVPQSSLKIPLILDKNGEGDMEFVPPAYLKYSFLNKQLPIKENDKGVHGLSGNLWAADVPVSIAYEDEDGNPGTFIFHIQVCRPPVMLVHGFTGNETTWEHLAVQLRRDRYDAIVREYYKGPPDESTIERQAQKLGRYIQELRKAYLDNGIIQNRVDIVAHSMGGLISRYYISNMAKYGKAAGIWIPYNVKLTRQELAQQRFQKPVVLNDVRKLIMVGTPNHGASFTDERIGAWSALINKVHQLANGELRYDSPFLAKLNAGESEGRHLDPNVQYALIYGMRRRSQTYPLDNILYPVKTALRKLANDDGVVTVQSAKLNGVMSYGFPADRQHYAYGYIHSPALGNFCKGDAAITTDTVVFNKIEDLLQDDIPRVPLKNAETRIIHANGQLFMRYYATQNWIPVRTPLTYKNPKKLVYNFCRLKTKDGSATLGFFLNGYHWGNLMVQPHSIVYYDFTSPEYVRIYLQKGKVRFRSKKQDCGGFDVVMGDKTGEKWYAFNPKARVKDLNTDFIVEQDSIIDVQSISGKVVLTLPPQSGKKPVAKTFSTKGGFVLSSNGTLTSHPLPDSGWWSNMDTAFLPNYIYDSNRFILPKNTVQLSFSEPYLPVSGFGTLKIHVDSLPGDTLTRNYRVKIILKNDSLLPFITLITPTGTTDSLGQFKTEITFREPAPGDYSSLGKIPLNARFNIVLYRGLSDTVVFYKELPVPLGMTLFTGQTTGPGLKPRKEPPPRLNQIIYQIATESDSAGHFYTLFNTTAYNKNRLQLKKLAAQAQEATVKGLEHFVLQWSADGMFPLSYQLDGLKSHFLPGKTIVLGRKKQIDILSPPEQEKRLKQMLKSFIKTMPLYDLPKTLLLDKLEELTFQYQAQVDAPIWQAGDNRIAIPESNKTFWNLNKNNHSMAYPVLLEVFRHFLQYNLFNGQHRDFKGEADFFHYLFFNYLKDKYDRFVLKSIYFQPVDTTKFPKQTRFLIRYYGNRCTENPVGVYSDFLLTKMLYAHGTDNGEEASTLQEWLLAKITYGQKVFIVKTDNPDSLATKYGLLPDKWYPVLIPRDDFANSSVQVGNKTITDFRQSPSLTLTDTSLVNIVRGRFLLQIPAAGLTSLVMLQQGSSFKTDTANRLILESGYFNFKAPVPFRTAQASFFPKSSNFMVSIDPKHTVLKVYEGEVALKNDKADLVIHQGESTSISRSGSIKKPRPMNEITPPDSLTEVRIPFVLNK